MSRVAQYEVVCGGDSEELSRKVSSRIVEGWEPYGFPLTHGSLLLQALVRSTTPPKRMRKTSED